MNSSKGKSFITERNISMSKKYYIYLFKDSLDNVIYVGMTTTFERRVFQHKDKEWFVNVSKVFKSEPLENETVAKNL